MSIQFDNNSMQILFNLPNMKPGDVVTSYSGKTIEIIKEADPTIISADQNATLDMIR